MILTAMNLEDVPKNIYFINENSTHDFRCADAMQSPLNEFMHVCTGYFSVSSF
jgi:hypothetical protein